MKKLAITFSLLLSVLSQTAIACDEECLRDKAQATHDVTFPKYLTWKYCEGIARDFITSSMRSLDNYRENHFDTKYKGPLKNTRSYLEARKDWLLECDNYMKLTKNVRVFNDDDTTEKIFASIDQLNNEFTALINGATYSNEDDAKAVMDENVDELLQIVDDHKTMMHLKGRYVFR